jgi:hypothetical protein
MGRTVSYLVRCCSVATVLLPQAAHLDALASGTQLTSLVLAVYQAAHSRCPLDPLMALTNLQHLEVMYGGRKGGCIWFSALVMLLLSLFMFVRTPCRREPAIGAAAPML